MCPKDVSDKLSLQAALAHLGHASRRKGEELIKSGRVEVNGQAVLIPATRVDLASDRITVDGKAKDIPKKVYFLLNKPKGVTTTVKDRHAKQTVLDLIKQNDLRVYPVGRLDKDTSGLLIISNDGDLAYRLTHPKFGIKKVYRVCVKGMITCDKISKLEAGILLDGKRTFPCRIEIISAGKHNTRLKVELTEGRKRQIKKMFAKVGHPVLEIHRTAFGSLELAGLKVGQWRPLRDREVAELKRAVGLK